MKVQDLLENKNSEHEEQAKAKLKDLMSKVADAIEDELDIDLDESKSGRYLTYESPDMSHLKIIGSVGQIHRYNNGDKVTPIADGSFVLDIPFKPVGLFEKLRAKISTVFKEQGIHLGWSNGSPWHFDDHARYTASYQLMKFPKEDKEPSEKSSGGRYDPRAEFMSRPGEMAKQRRVAQSAYSDSFGGDSSNYRR